MEKIIAFFMAVLAFFSSLFGMKTECKAYLDVSYGTDSQQTLDLYVPDGYDKTVGLVLMIHGGSWQRGDKEQFAENIKNDSEEYGVACASMNYRLLSYFNDISMQDMYDDVTAAIKKCVETAAAQGVKIDKVMLRGHSAGGHIALLYAYNCADISPVKVAAVYAESAICDMTKLDLYYLGGQDGVGTGNGIAWAENLCILGSKLCGHTYTLDTFDENIEYIKTISPAYCVTKNSVPTLLTHGKQDNVVPFNNTDALVSALKQNKVKYDFIVSETAQHGLGSDPEAASKAASKYGSYIKSYLK